MPQGGSHRNPEMPSASHALPDGFEGPLGGF